jgi:Holliday junction resolvasome RuvABC endonuclease subunit
MPKIMGLDASIRKAGFCILDTDAPMPSYLERGRLYTTPADGILIQRLLKQQAAIEAKLDKWNIDFVSMEAPILNAPESEHLFALNQFIHQVFLKRGTFVIAFPPQQLKKLAMPDIKIDSEEVGKAHMQLRAQVYYDLEGRNLTDDEADALHAGRLGKIFYNWHFQKTLKDSDLEPLILKAFKGKHTYTRGAKTGVTDYNGMIFRENELFFDFNMIAKRQIARTSKKV